MLSLESKRHFKTPSNKIKFQSTSCCMRAQQKQNRSKNVCPKKGNNGNPITLALKFLEI